jgi:hypothetical protein
MNFILFDDKSWDNLLPLTFTRPVCEIRIGILTIKEKWEKVLNTHVSYITQDYLSVKYPLKTDTRNILINGSVIPDSNLVNEINKLNPSEALIKNNQLIAVNISSNDISKFTYSDFSAFKSSEYQSEIFKINWPWDIFSQNGKAIESDFLLITTNRKSQAISSTNNLLRKRKYFC